MDENSVVQLGFRTRPLRDGRGKPSWWNGASIEEENRGLQTLAAR